MSDLNVQCSLEENTPLLITGDTTIYSSDFFLSQNREEIRHDVIPPGSATLLYSYWVQCPVTTLNYYLAPCCTTSNGVCCCSKTGCRDDALLVFPIQSKYKSWKLLSCHSFFHCDSNWCFFSSTHSELLCPHLELRQISMTHQKKEKKKEIEKEVENDD